MIEAFLECGLVQFGRFETENGFKPYLLNFHLLPAYPDLLREIGKEVALRVNQGQFDRLLCSADSVPLGVAVSLETGIPLVYSRGRNEPATRDLVGTYDVGHPAALVVNVLDDSEDMERLIKRAHSVGLEVNCVVAVVSTHPLPSVKTHSLFDLHKMVETLVQSGSLTIQQAQAIDIWHHK